LKYFTSPEYKVITLNSETEPGIIYKYYTDETNDDMNRLSFNNEISQGFVKHQLTLDDMNQIVQIIIYPDNKLTFVSQNTSTKTLYKSKRAHNGDDVIDNIIGTSSQNLNKKRTKSEEANLNLKSSPPTSPLPQTSSWGISNTFKWLLSSDYGKKDLINFVKNSFHNEAQEKSGEDEARPQTTLWASAPICMAAKHWTATQSDNEDDDVNRTNRMSQSFEANSTFSINQLK
jgi:hypothetical protein